MSISTIAAATAAAAILALGAALPARAEGERAGDFDYYVLALSWAPSWCATDGAGRGASQCDPARDANFVLHGLWPQYEGGYPSYCRTVERDPSRSQSAAMEDIMGSDGAAWYQWKKHGRCAGLSATSYYETAREAYESIAIPEVFERLNKDVKLPASVVEEAFLEANPGLRRDAITITCADGRIQEARICLTKDLEPRRCGPDVIRDCTLKNALMEQVR